MPTGQFLWPHSLRHRSAAAQFLGVQVQNLLKAWMFISCICCVRGSLSDEMITHSLESYCAHVCARAHVHAHVRERDLETSKRDSLGPSWAVAPQEGNMPTGLYFVLKYFCFTVTILLSQENIYDTHEVITEFDCFLILVVSKFKLHCLQFSLWTV